MIWLIVIGLVMGTGTLGVASWAEQERTAAVAHTMGLVTFSLFSMFFSITTGTSGGRSSASTRSRTGRSTSRPWHRC